MAEATQVSGMYENQGQEDILSTDENGQMTMPGLQSGNSAHPDGASRKSQTAYPISDDEDINIDDYEMVDPEFFAQIKEAAFTVNVDKTTANAASVRMLPNAEYVKYMINRKEKRLILKPCSEYDIRGFRWAREKNGRRYAAPRTGRIFVLFICSVMGWNPDNRYKIMGKKSRAKGEEVLVFDLSVAKCYEKSNGKDLGADAQASSILAGWDGRFGPTYGEDKRSLQIDTFDGYTVFSLNEQKKARKDREIEEVPATTEGEDNQVNHSAAIETQKDATQEAVSSEEADHTQDIDRTTSALSSEEHRAPLEAVSVTNADNVAESNIHAPETAASGESVSALETDTTVALSTLGEQQLKKQDGVTSSGEISLNEVRIP